jgi:hypothetical protein
MTDSTPARLAYGDWIEFEDERHQVVGWADTAVRLRSETGAMQLIAAAALMAAPSFRPAEAPSDTEDGAGLALDPTALLDGIPDDAVKKAIDLEAHLLEVTTGYRSGDPDTAEPGEPRPEYLPELSLHQRIQPKATELGYTPRRLYQMINSWEADGIWALVDKRKARPRNPLARLDPRIIDAIRDQDAAERFDSTGSVKRFRRRVQNRLDAAHGEGAVPLPSEDTFRRAARLLLNGRHTFGSSKTRQTTANQPQRSFGHLTAQRPGEVVMLDTTPLDVLAYDPLTDSTGRVELTIAIDLCTRSLLAWRLTPEGTKSIDIGLLVADAMTPEPMRAG